MAQQFCTNCGTELLGGACFCVACGRAANGASHRRFGLWWPAERIAPIAVVVALLGVGAAAVVVGRMAPVTRAGLPGRGDSTAGSVEDQQLPAGHPPVQIPEDVREAIRSLATRAAAAPGDVAVWKQLAEVQYRAGLVEPAFLTDAAAAFRHVLELEPGNIDALRGLGNVAFDQDQPATAIGYYEQVLKARPDDRDVHTDLATMYLSAGRAQDAIVAYEAVLEANPGFFQAQFNLALALQAAGEAARARTALERAQAMAPDDKTRQQVAQIITRLKSGPPPTVEVEGAAAPAAQPSGPLTFQADTERLFRDNPVLAPKIQGIEWPNPSTVRVIVADFPMDSMGDEMKAKFVERMQSRLREKKTAHGISETARIEFVDAPSGTVMAAVSE